MQLSYPQTHEPDYIFSSTLEFGILVIFQAALASQASFWIKATFIKNLNTPKGHHTVWENETKDFCRKEYKPERAKNQTIQWYTQSISIRNEG